MSDEKALAPVQWNFDQALSYIQKEWDLDWKEARKLLRVAGAAVINEMSVREAIEIARAYNLPLRAIALIPTQNGLQPYVSADGFRWAFRTDPRKPKSIETEILKYPWDTEERVAVVRAVATFEDGSVYTAYGAASKSKRGRDLFTDEDLLMLAETKAVRRCLVNAIAFPFRPVEDVLEEQNTPVAEKPVIIQEEKAPFNIDTFVPKNIVEALATARSELNLTPEILNKVLGTNAPVPVYRDKFMEAWEKIKKYVKETTEDA